MKTLNLSLRRVRSSLRTDLNTGSRSTQSGSKSYGVGTGVARGACVQESRYVCADDVGSAALEPALGGR
ncbi:MAG: hypothetical protein U0174_18675 [Polyangiaceae bacterium]